RSSIASIVEEIRPRACSTARRASSVDRGVRVDSYPDSPDAPPPSLSSSPRILSMRMSRAMILLRCNLHCDPALHYPFPTHRQKKRPAIVPAALAFLSAQGNARRDL